MVSRLRWSRMDFTKIHSFVSSQSSLEGNNALVHFCLLICFIFPWETVFTECFYWAGHFILMSHFTLPAILEMDIDVTSLLTDDRTGFEGLNNLSRHISGHEPVQVQNPSSDHHVTLLPQDLPKITHPFSSQHLPGGSG